MVINTEDKQQVTFESKTAIVCVEKIGTSCEFRCKRNPKSKPYIELHHSLVERTCRIE